MGLDCVSICLLLVCLPGELVPEIWESFVCFWVLLLRLINTPTIDKHCQIKKRLLMDWSQIPQVDATFEPLVHATMAQHPGCAVPTSTESDGLHMLCEAGEMQCDIVVCRTLQG